MLDRAPGDAQHISALEAPRAALDRTLDDAHIGAPEAPCAMLDRALDDALIGVLKAPCAALDRPLHEMQERSIHIGYVAQERERVSGSMLVQLPPGTVERSLHTGYVA